MLKILCVCVLHCLCVDSLFCILCSEQLQFSETRKAYIYIYYFDSTGPERGKNIAALGTKAMGGFISMMSKKRRRAQSSAAIAAVIYIRYG